MNAISRSLSVNYGSVYELPLNLKTGDGDLPANHGTGFTDEMRMRIEFD